jgi:hypothetical protein
MQIDKRALDIGAKQGGVILRRQAYELGFTAKMIRKRVGTAAWSKVSDDAFLVITPRDDTDRLTAAVTSLHGAVVSHESAARIHGISCVPWLPNTVTVEASQTHRFPGVVVRRTRDMQTSHAVRIAALPVTSIERTTIDLASRLAPQQFRDMFDELVVSKRLDLDRVRKIHGEIGGRGKPGSAVVAAVLEECADGFIAAGSALEQLGRRTLRRWGLPDPTHEYPLPWDPDKRFDEAYPEARLAVEWDSRRWHTKRTDMNRDRARDRSAVEHGWVIVRITWQDLRESPEESMVQLKAILKTRTTPD